VSGGLANDLAEAIRAERSATIDKLGREPTLWLAAAPLWTRYAAEATGFPAASVLEFVNQARDVGWCETRGSRLSRSAGELQFWLRDEVRREVIDILSRRDGTELVRRQAKEIAERVASATTTLPATLRVWAELMSQAVPERALVERVRLAVEADDLSHAQQLVTAGEALAPLLAGAVELAVDRARRLMNLGARRRQDGRALGRYLDRESLSDPVSSLLDPDTDQWALHLRGVGGVGKTMLVRYLASGRYAAERGSSVIAIARADFDHISADYPVRRPVQLLLELADELALHTAASTGADRALASFRATATSAHEALSSLREERAPPLEHPLVLRAIDDFAQAIDRLPGVVLLILDTCEELAKVDAGNPAAPAVQATLAIIERLHDRAPLTRVLLAGRRPLPARPYLAVEEVAGFTVGEARRYLTTFSARPLASDVVDTLIRLSPAVHVTVPSAGTSPEALPDCVSPFDLALYLSWAEEDPGLDMRRIEAAGRDAYVEGRIIDRLDDPVVLGALPVMALLGRCRVSTLAALVDESADVLGARLAEQEWIEADDDPPTHLTVKPGLVRGLRHYFNAPRHRAEFTATATRLAKSLGRDVGRLPLADVDVDELLAALRWSEPTEAAGLWEQIVERAEIPPGRWGWIFNVARRVLGESEEEQWPTADALRATVIAAYLAASRRADPSLNPRGMWTEVRRWADRHPDQAAAQILRARAALGSLLDADDDEQSGWADLRAVGPSPALAAAAVDAADRLLEAEAFAPVRRLVQDDHFQAALAGDAGGRVRAWAHVVLGRLRADGDMYALAEAEAADAATAADTAAGAERAWADWVPPVDLLARVRIECGLFASANAVTVNPVARTAWESYAAANLASIDGERLASLCLQLRLAGGTIERSEIERWEELDGYEPSRAPTCSAHDLVPPLCVTLAEAELAAGRPERALALIQQRRTEALSARHEHADDSTLRLVDAETVRLARRLRLDDQRATLARLSSLGHSDPSLLELQDAARRAMAVVHHEPPKQVGPEVWNRAAGWHAWWQCQSVPPTVLPPVHWLDQPARSAAELADIEFDLEELSRLGHPAVKDLKQELANWLSQPPLVAAPARSADPFAAVRVALRREALTGNPSPAKPGIPERRLAEVAFEEAELLAPRLPLTATWLFERAARAYAGAGDAVGELLAAAALAELTARGRSKGFQAAWDGLRGKHPDIAEALTRPGPGAGPWRFWAALVRQLLYPQSAPPPAPPGQLATAFSQVRAGLAAVLRWTWLAVVVGVSGASVVGLVAVGAGISEASLPAFLIVCLGFSLFVLLLASPYLIVGIPRTLRLADGRGACTLRPSCLHLTATVRADPGHTGQVRLLIEPRPLREAPAWQWPRLALALPAVRLVRAVRRRPPTGYHGEFHPDSAEQVQVDWTELPKTKERWWRKVGRAAGGDIRLEPTQAAQPWERILATSLGPGAEGRIEWVRLLTTSAKPFEVSDATAVAVDAPSAWKADLDARYGAVAGSRSTNDAPLRLRHTMGRAIATSAGPRLDISGEATAVFSTEVLLDAGRLVRGRPALVVLQAEPADEVVDVGLRDDSPERLALAADLIEAGAPAVLVVPALRTDLARAVIRAIAEQAATSHGRGMDARQLRAKLGREIQMRSANPSSVLEALVLYLNPRRDQ
jgi:hypothetical protein